MIEVETAAVVGLALIVGLASAPVAGAVHVGPSDAVPSVVGDSIEADDFGLIAPYETGPMAVDMDIVTGTDLAGAIDISSNGYWTGAFDNAERNTVDSLAGPFSNPDAELEQDSNPDAELESYSKLEPPSNTEIPPGVGLKPAFDLQSELVLKSNPVSEPHLAPNMELVFTDVVDSDAEPNLAANAESNLATDTEPNLDVASDSDSKLSAEIFARNDSTNHSQQATTNETHPIGTEISSFMQSSTVGTESAVDEGMFEAAYENADDETKAAIIHERMNTLEERLDAIERAKLENEDLVNANATSNSPAAIAHHTRLAVQLDSLDRSLKSIEQRGEEAGVDTDRIAELRRNASAVGGPATFAVASGIPGVEPPGLEERPPAVSDTDQRSSATDRNTAAIDQRSTNSDQNVSTDLNSTASAQQHPDVDADEPIDGLENETAVSE